MTMNKKAVALFSGGLDSMLAIKLMLEQGIEVHALNFLTVFCTCTSKGCMHQATKAAKELGIKLKVMNITKEYMEIIKNAKFGYGRGMNPCIDCRIFTFRKAASFMKKIGASFIVTGEVVGQRPMSQRRNAIEIIERESGLSGLILRPLSAKLFEQTLPEKEGIVDRARLLNIQGRSREKQITLAKELGINEYPCPAGGCLLTDKKFSDKVRDLFKYIPGYTISDIHLLKIGRQFRLSKAAKLFVGRNENENSMLLSFAQPGDFIFDVPDIPSPIGLLRGKISRKERDIASSIVARYSDSSNGKIDISFRIFPSEVTKLAAAKSATQATLDSLRL